MEFILVHELIWVLDNPDQLVEDPFHTYFIQKRYDLPSSRPRELYPAACSTLATLLTLFKAVCVGAWRRQAIGSPTEAYRRDNGCKNTLPIARGHIHPIHTISITVIATMRQ
jgi:hypothetical protein